MSTVRQYNKAADTVYVYDVEYYYVPSRKRTMSRRRLIGKVDPETGNVVPTGKRGRPPKELPPGGERKRAAAEGELQAARSREQEYKDRIHELEQEVKRLNGVINEVRRAIG